MLKKTRNKFILTTALASMLVLGLIFGSLNAAMVIAVRSLARDTLDLIVQRRGFIYTDSSVSGGGASPGHAMQYIYIKYYKPESGIKTPFITTNMNGSYTSDGLLSLAQGILDRSDAEGTYGDFMYSVQRDDLVTVVAAVDLSRDNAMLRSVLSVSGVIIGIGILIVAAFTLIFSRWALRPVRDAFDKQRRFISDASHELKTPLTVISASADVLEAEIGENRWLKNIESQSRQMSELVHDLLDLAKLDETGETPVFTEFDLSDLVLTKALEFEAAAFEAHRRFEQNIAEGIRCTGSKNDIAHLVGILIDNAIRHSDENGLVRVTLEQSGGKRLFQVYNTGPGIPQEDRDRIFQRFYRSDASRSRETGGYGLGLSIAKGIADMHKGSITVDGEQGKWITFTVIL